MARAESGPEQGALRAPAAVDPMDAEAGPAPHANDAAEAGPAQRAEAGHASAAPSEAGPEELVMCVSCSQMLFKNDCAHMPRLRTHLAALRL